MEKYEIGAAAWGFRELGLEEQLKLCRKLGFSSLELGIANAPKDIPLNVSDEEIQKVCELYQKYQMCLWCAATGNDFTVEEGLNEQIEKIKKVILICEKAGISYLRIFAGFSAVREVTGNRWSEMIRAVNEVADFSLRHQVTLALETHGGVNVFSDGVEHFASVTTDYAAVEKMLKEIRENVSFVFDPANLVAASVEEPLQLFHLMRNRIAYMHLKNFIKMPSGHLDPAPLGSGIFDWEVFHSQTEGWKGRYMIEFEKPEILEQGCQESIDYLCRHQEEEKMSSQKDYRDYKTSRAIVIERPHEAKLREIQLTKPREDAYIARTLYSSISSGTDMKTYKGLQHPEQCWYPLVPGYETAGIVVAAGPKTDGKLKVGDRVMINECRLYGDVCAAWGGGSEYTIKDSQTMNDTFDYMVKIPDNVSDKDAVLAYLPCVALKGIRRLTLKAGETVVVVGAGMVGVSAIQILKILEPTLTVISVERNKFRRGIAQLYADVVTDPENAVEVIREKTNGKMADKVIECSGNPEVPGILYKYIKDGGWGADDEPAHIHLQGDYPEKIIMDSYHRWFVKNCTITMTCALAAGCKEQILTWMSEGKFDTSKLPVETWPVSKCAEAYAYQEKMGDDVFKIIFDWSR